MNAGQFTNTPRSEGMELLQVKKLADLFDQTKWARFLNRKEVELLVRYMSLQEFSEGEWIFRQGDKDDYMAFILEGQVDILKENIELTEKMLVSLKEGTHFGEMAFIDDEPRSASALAGKDCLLLILSRENFEHILEDHPQLGIKILKEIARMLSRRLRMTTGQLVYLRG